MPYPLVRAWLDIDISRIQKNYQTIVNHVYPAKVMAVLKANAYGLGVIPIAKALCSVGVHCIGVANINEAISLQGIGVPVHILGGIFPEEIPEIVRHDIVAPITDKAVATRLHEEGIRQQKKARGHFLIDSGMGRLGILLSEAKTTISSAYPLSHLDCEGLFSHFPHAYGDEIFSIKQIAAIIDLIQYFQVRHHISFPSLHIANSDAINNIPKSYAFPFTMVRTGINLYGLFDEEGKKAFPLREVLTLKSRLIAIRRLEKGTSLGYGKSYKLPAPTLVGTVAIGYADGFPFYLSGNNIFVSIRGRNCSVLGRVSMDYITVCLDNVSEACIGDEVICLGGEITVQDWTANKDTIPYEVICSIGNRVIRRYLP